MTRAERIEASLRLVMAAAHHSEYCLDDCVCRLGEAESEAHAALALPPDPAPVVPPGFVEGEAVARRLEEEAVNGREACRRRAHDGIAAGIRRSIRIVREMVRGKSTK